MEKLFNAIKTNRHPSTIAKIARELHYSKAISKNEYELLKVIYSAYLK